MSVFLTAFFFFLASEMSSEIAITKLLVGLSFFSHDVAEAITYKI